MCILFTVKMNIYERNKWHLLLIAQTVQANNCYFHSCQYFTDTQNIPTHMCVWSGTPEGNNNTFHLSKTSMQDFLHSSSQSMKMNEGH